MIDKIVGYFRPALALLEWKEVSSLVTNGFYQGYFQFKRFIKAMWWLVIIKGFFDWILSTYLYPLFVSNALPENLFPNLLSGSLSSLNKAITFFLTSYEPLSYSSFLTSFSQFLFVFLIFFIALLYVRSSRSDKDNVYVFAYLNNYFLPAAVMCFIIERYFIFRAFSALCLLFFFDSDKSLSDIFKSIENGLRTFFRFFLVVFVVQALFLFGLLIVTPVFSLLLSLVGQVGVVLLKFCLENLNAYIAFDLEVVRGMLEKIFFLNLLNLQMVFTAFVDCALISLVYYKIRDRFDYLFLQDSDE